MDLFDYMRENTQKQEAPLASRLRPRTLDEIVGQLQAVQNVAKPETEAINALWDLMYEYADMMDTAGYYYKRISLSTYVVTRRYYRALFENRLGRAHALYEEFKHQTAVYDGLLQNWAE